MKTSNRRKRQEKKNVILNEVKNRIATKGKPTAEILHFVQND